MSASDRIDQLEAELAALRAEMAASSPPTRRGALKLAAGLATGAVVTAAGAGRAAAAVSYMKYGATTDGAIDPTVVAHITAQGADGAVFISYDLATGAPPVTFTSVEYPAALSGVSFTPNSPHGIVGMSTIGSGAGVVGIRSADGGAAVYGESRGAFGIGVSGDGVTGMFGTGSTTGVEGAGPVGVYGYGQAVSGRTTGVKARGHDGVLASGYEYGLRLAGGATALVVFELTDGETTKDRTPPPSRTDAHVRGELDVDAGGNLWFCVEAGTPGRWAKIAGPSSGGAFHPLAPTRVYDSRNDNAPMAGGPLAAGANRVVSVKDARPSGPVTAADIVPAGATAITCQIAVVDTVGSGFLSANPGDATTFTAATINWSTTGQILNNGTVVKLDNNRQVKLFAGGPTGAGASFVIDVTGYYL